MGRVAKEANRNILHTEPITDRLVGFARVDPNLGDDAVRDGPTDVKVATAAAD